MVVRIDRARDRCLAELAEGASARGSRRSLKPSSSTVALLPPGGSTQLLDGTDPLNRFDRRGRAKGVLRKRQFANQRLR